MAGHGHRSWHGFPDFGLSVVNFLSVWLSLESDWLFGLIPVDWSLFLPAVSASGDCEVPPPNTFCTIMKGQLARLLGGRLSGLDLTIDLSAVYRGRGLVG